MRRSLLLEAEGDPALGKIVWRHFNVYAVTGQNANTVLAHLAARVSENGVLVVECDAEHGVRQQFHDGAGELDEVFF
ncbi:hypothetical protein AD936_13090 [Gluconobacter japonicus]|nr:hypothetical protein AD936_13090 [Gluconobacter japonicus]